MLVSCATVLPVVGRILLQIGTGIVVAVGAEYVKKLTNPQQETQKPVLEIRHTNCAGKRAVESYGIENADQIGVYAVSGKVTIEGHPRKKIVTVAPGTVATIEVFQGAGGRPVGMEVGQEGAALSCSEPVKAKPSGKPSAKPSGKPSAKPSGKPSAKPSGKPSAKPSGKPSAKPSGKPSAKPSGKPSAKPSGKPSAKPSVTAPDPLAMPRGFVGRWRGPATQSGSSDYGVDLTLKAGEVGDAVGRIRYPGLECGGTLTLQSINRSRVTLREEITVDPRYTCVRTGVVTLARSAAGRLAYRWFYGANETTPTVTAPLSRQ